jgi:hypothetical protein
MLVFMLDTIVGMALTIALYRATAKMAARWACTEPLSRVGDYEASPNPDGLRPCSTFCQRAVRRV